MFFAQSFHNNVNMIKHNYAQMETLSLSKLPTHIFSSQAQQRIMGPSNPCKCYTLSCYIVVCLSMHICGIFQVHFSAVTLFYSA